METRVVSQRVRQAAWTSLAAPAALPTSPQSHPVETNTYLEQAPAAVIHQAQLAPQRRHAPVGIVGAQDEAVLRSAATGVVWVGEGGWSWSGCKWAKHAGGANGWSCVGVVGEGAQCAVQSTWVGTTVLPPSRLCLLLQLPLTGWPACGRAPSDPWSPNHHQRPQNKRPPKRRPTKSLLLSPAGQHTVGFPKVLGHQIIQQRPDVRRLPGQRHRLLARRPPRRVQPRHQALCRRLLITCRVRVQARVTARVGRQQEAVLQPSCTHHEACAGACETSSL